MPKIDLFSGRSFINHHSVVRPLASQSARERECLILQSTKCRGSHYRSESDAGIGEPICKSKSARAAVAKCASAYFSRSRADAIVAARRRLRVYFTRFFFNEKARVTEEEVLVFLKQFTLGAKIRVRPPARQLCLPSLPNSQGRRLTDAHALSCLPAEVSPFLQFVSARCFLFIFNAVV